MAARRAAVADAVSAMVVVRRQAGGRLALSIGVEGEEQASALEARVDYDPRALRLRQVRTVGSARNAVLASRDDPPGTLRLAVASAVPFESGGQPLLVVVFETPTGARPVVTPAVALRVE